MSVQSGLPGKATYFAAGEAHFADGEDVFGRVSGLLMSSLSAADTFFKHRCIERVALGHQEVEGDSALECKLSGVDMSKGPPTTNNSTYNMKLQVRDSKGKGQQWLKAPELPSPGCLHVKLRLLSLYFSSASRPSTANNRSLQINKSGSRWEIATGCSRNTAK